MAAIPSPADRPFTAWRQGLHAGAARGGFHSGEAT